MTRLSNDSLRLQLRPGRHGRERQGAAAVELAILLPFLVLMFAAAIDVARVFHVTQILEDAAYAGGLYASGTAWNPGPSADPTQAAQTAAVADGVSLNPPLTAQNVSVTTGSGTVTVTVAYDFPLVTAVMNSAQTIHLTRTVTFKQAPQPGD